MTPALMSELAPSIPLHESVMPALAHEIRQPLGAIDGAGAELSQADRIAVEAGGEASVRLRFERDGTAQSRGNTRCRGPPPCLSSGSAHADWIL